jgi:thiol-disulfide isomerase/thioredoxin
MKLRVLSAALMIGVVLGAAERARGQADDKEGVKQPGSSAPKLVVGDKAPALAIEKWVKGEPVTGFEKGKVYVVEFWATWCGPCIKSMPHLTELQKKHRKQGLTIVSVTAEDSNNSLAAVEAMVKEKGDEGMGYTVAWDKGRATTEAYRKAAGINWIPSAFVVNKEGVIAWIGNPGHPEGEFDRVLGEVVTDKYDLKAAVEKYRGEKTREEEAERKRKAAEDAAQALEDAQAERDWPKALEAIDVLIGTNPERDAVLSREKFRILLTQTHEYEKAYAWGREAAKKYWKEDAESLNSAAWWTLDEEGVEKRDVDFAMELAMAAVKASNEEDEAILDTLAYAYYHKGDLEKALSWQKKAVAAIKPTTMKRIKDELESRLKMYEEEIKKKKEK